MKYVSQVFEGSRFAADGPFSRSCQKIFAGRFGLENTFLTSSASAALDGALLLLKLNPGDEVILPSFIFPSAGNAIVRAGGIPVFAEIRPDTLNLDEKKWHESISERTKAVIVMHYGGVATEMTAIRNVAQSNGIAVIEDAAQALGAEYRGKACGTLGDASVFSFHETKNVISGEGGLLVVNRNDWIRRAEVICDKGTDRKRFLRGEVEQYSWVGIGGNFGLSEIQAAFLMAQLEGAAVFGQGRKILYERYLEGLGRWESLGAIRLPQIPPHCTSNYHTFYLILSGESAARSLMADLKENLVGAVTHYYPLHQSDMGRRYGLVKSSLEITESLSRRIIRLPLYPGLSFQEQDSIMEIIGRWCERQYPTAPLSILGERGVDTVAYLEKPVIDR